MQRRRFLKSSAVLAAAAGTPGCGYLLYPERRGTVGGRIDLAVLVIDLLWLLPGLLPGAICLAVDFTTGCIYASGGSADRTDADGEVLLAEVDVDEDVVARTEVERRKGSLEWNQSISEDKLKERGRLVVRGPNGQIASAMIRTLVPPA